MYHRCCVYTRPHDGWVCDVMDPFIAPIYTRDVPHGPAEWASNRAGELVRKRDVRLYSFEAACDRGIEFIVNNSHHAYPTQRPNNWARQNVENWTRNYSWYTYKTRLKPWNIIFHIWYFEMCTREERKHRVWKKNIIQQQQQRMTTANKHFVLKCKTKRKQNAHFYANEKNLSVILLYFFLTRLLLSLCVHYTGCFFFVVSCNK